MKKARNLYLVTLRVIPAGAGSPYETSVHVVADDFDEASKAAGPVTGFYSFEIESLKLVGKAIVAA